MPPLRSAISSLDLLKRCASNISWSLVVPRGRANPMPTSPNDSMSRSATEQLPRSTTAHRSATLPNDSASPDKPSQRGSNDATTRVSTDLSTRREKPPTNANRIHSDIEALICEMRRNHRRWGARRICFERIKDIRDIRDIRDRTPSRATVHRILVRSSLVNHQEQQHERVQKRLQREAPMHLQQLDLVGGKFLVGGRECKIPTGIDDQSRFIVTATVLERPPATRYARHSSLPHTGEVRRSR